MDLTVDRLKNLSSLFQARIKKGKHSIVCIARTRHRDVINPMLGYSAVGRENDSSKRVQPR